MAYVFSAIKDAMGKDQQVKQDIFAPQQNPSQGGDASAMGGMTPKTTTEGIIGSAGGGGSQSAEGMPADVKANDNRIVSQNKMATPGFVGKAKSDLSAAQTGIQNEANAYTTGYADTNYSLDDASLEGAIGGDAAALAKVTALRDGTNKETAAAFEPKTAFQINDIDAMRTDEGTKGLLRRNAGAQYTGGESAFDMMLLNRTPEFNTIRSQLLGDQAALTKNVDEMRGSKVKDAQALIDKAYAEAQTGLVTALGGKATTLTKAQEDEMEAENKALAELRKTGNPDLVSKESKRVLDQMLRDNAGKDQYGDAGYISRSGADAGQFYNVRDDYTGIYDFVDAKEAARFNVINQLLGKGDNWSAGKGAGARDSFNRTGFGGAIEEGAKKANAAADAKAARELKTLLDRIKAKGGDISVVESGVLNSLSRELGQGDAHQSTPYTPAPTPEKAAAAAGGPPGSYDPDEMIKIGGWMPTGIKQGEAQNFKVDKPSADKPIVESDPVIKEFRKRIKI